MRLWIAVASLTLTLSSPASAYLLSNGDFEAVGGKSWIYEGENDGSHGVFLEPTRPDSRVYMLQLDGRDQPGFSSIRQTVKVKPGQAYRLSLDLYDNQQGTGKGDIQVVTINGLHAFTHHLSKGLPGEGWVTRQVTFRADSPELEISIGVRGQAKDREGSTTLVDNVNLELSAKDLPLPLKRGKPLAEVSRRLQLPTSVAYGANGVSLSGFEAIQRYENSFGHYPALSTWFGGWDLSSTESFEPTRQAVEPWIRQGVVPIVAPAIPQSQAADILAGKHDAYFKEWAEQTRNWGYPMVLRPWPEMDSGTLGFGDGQSGTPGEFVKLWRHLHKIFKEAGARNILWFWSPSVLSKDTRPYYPGDAQVDIVGCSLYAEWGDNALQDFTEYHLHNYRNRAFAIAQGASEKGRQAAWLGTILGSATTRYPRMEFYTHYNFEDSSSGIDYRIEHTEGAMAYYQKWLDGPMAQHRLAQLVPPKLDVTVLQTAQVAEAILINLGGENSPDTCMVKVEFWAGHPDQGGERIGNAELPSLKTGESQTLRRPWPPKETRKLHVRIDQSVDPSFLVTAPDPSDTKVYVE